MERRSDSVPLRGRRVSAAFPGVGSALPERVAQESKELRTIARGAEPGGQHALGYSAAERYFVRNAMEKG